MNWKNIEQAGMAFGIWAISVFALIAAAVLLGILILLVSAHVAEAQTPGVITWPGESTSPGTCAIGVIGSAEVYLRLYYDNPNAPEAPIVYKGPTHILADEAVTVAYDWHPVAHEWYQVDPYALLKTCGTVPSEDYYPIVPDPAPDPFNGPHAIPGTVEAEDFNVGGEGVGYHDRSTQRRGNSTYRADEAVDIKTIPDGHAIGWMQSGEWLEYTVVAERSETFEVSARVLSAVTTSRIEITMDGEIVGNQVELPRTGEWNSDSWVSIPVGEVFLAAGEHVLRFLVVTQWLDFDRIEVASTGICPATTNEPVDAYARTYYMHEDPEAPGFRFMYQSESVYAQEFEVRYADFPTGVEWWFRPYGGIDGPTLGDFMLGKRCGFVGGE